MSPPAWSKQEFADLEALGRRVAEKYLTPSAFVFEIDDVVAQSLEELLRAQARGEVENPHGLLSKIVHDRALKVRTRWERERERGWFEDEPPKGGAGGVVKFARAGRGVVADDHGAGDPLAQLIAAGDLDALWTAVNALAPDDRRIAELTYLGTGPRKAPEVARELGLAPGTVRNRLVVIRRELAAALERAEIS